MKYTLLLLLIVSTKIIAQNEPRIETPFNSFTKLPTVEWAVRANDTLVCLKPDISKILVDKILKSTIIAASYLEEDLPREIKIKNITNEEIRMLLSNRPACELPIFDSNGNFPIVIKQREEDKQEYKNDLIKVYEKQFIINGKLNSTISYVSIIKDVITPQGIYLGKLEIFSTAFNKKNNYSPSPKDKIIFLTKTERELFVDSIKKENKYKETFGRNMVETLWPYVLANKLNVYSVATGKLLTLKEINSELIGNTSVIVPVYDSVGNATSKTIDKYPLQPNIFTKVIINQTWYYNDTKNIFFNKIPDIILYSKFVGEKELKPILKISFTK